MNNLDFARKYGIASPEEKAQIEALSEITKTVDFVGVYIERNELIFKFNKKLVFRESVNEQVFIEEIWNDSDFTKYQNETLVNQVLNLLNPEINNQKNLI